MSKQEPVGLHPKIKEQLDKLFKAKGFKSRGKYIKSLMDKDENNS